MTFSWEQFFFLADHLINNPTDKYPEAAYRTVISRSYYAAYHLTCEYAKNHCGFVPSYDGSDHMELIRKLNEKKISISRKLNDLHAARIKSDYNNKINVNQEYAHQSLINAKFIIEFVSK